MFLFPRIEKKAEKTARLYKQYGKLMYKIAYDILQDKQLAEDAVQGAFENVIKYLHKINEKNCPQTRHFLVIIVRNVALDISKKQKPIYASGAGELPDIADKDDVLDIVIARETAAELQSAIESLKPIYRDVYILRVARDYSITEIAQMLNIKEETAKKRLTRAKKMIAEKMEGRD